MVTPWEEDQILRDVTDGLSAAMDSSGLGSDNLDSIKFNKLLYIAIDDLELPVTYRWYKYGADLTFHDVSISDVEPRSISEIASPDEPRVENPESDGVDELPTPRDICLFYLDEVNDFEDIFRNDTKRYLRTFYQDYAPEPLVDLYTSCAILQKSLDNLGQADDPYGVISNTVDELLNEVSELNKQVHLSDDVADLDEKYQEYSQLLKDIVVSVSDRESGLTPREHEVFREVIRFFYNHAWKLVAQKIALSNSNGADSLRWRSTTLRQFESWLSTYPEDINSLRKQCADSGLVAEEFTKFWDMDNRDTSSESTELEVQGANEWKNVSREANQYL